MTADLITEPNKLMNMYAAAYTNGDTEDWYKV